jgi:hypothetical protein
MSTDLDFRRITEDWLVEGPAELSERVLDDALREVSRTRQRHPFGVPTGVRPMPLQLRLGAAAVIAVVAVGLFALNFGPAPGVGGPTGSPPSPTATVVPPTSTPAASAVAKTPAATVAGLVDGLYAALHARDTSALHALCADGGRHVVYYTDGVIGRQTTSFVNAAFDFATDPLRDVTRRGEPIVVGDLVAVPVTYTYPEEADSGFDIFYVTRVNGGLLVGSAATLFGKPDLVAGAGAMKTIATEIAAWNKDDTAGVLATMTRNAQFWEGFVDPSRSVHTMADMARFIETSNYWDVANVGPGMTSGTFVAVPQRLSSSDGGADGISIYEIRGAKIAMQVWASTP